MPAADSDLYRFGSGVLGYDCYHGKRLPAATIGELGKTRWDALTRAPRRYGFHATLKAPFLLQGGDERELARALDIFAAERRPLLPTRLKVERLADFAALVPQEPSASIYALAGECVRYFDRFRAPLAASERGRRAAAAQLSKRQVEYLDRYGYPFVLEEFRFHMTLTGPLPGTDRDRALSALRKRFVDMVPGRTLSFAAISLMKQASPKSSFLLLHQSPLGLSSGTRRKPPAVATDLQRRLRDEWT